MLGRMFLYAPSYPQLSGHRFEGVDDEGECSSKLTPSCSAPLMMSSLFTDRANALSFIFFRTAATSTSPMLLLVPAGGSSSSARCGRAAL